MEIRGKNGKFETPPVAPLVEGCIKPFFCKKKEKEIKNGTEMDVNEWKAGERMGSLKPLLLLPQ